MTVDPLSPNAHMRSAKSLRISRELARLQLRHSGELRSQDRAQNTRRPAAVSNARPGDQRPRPALPAAGSG